MIAIHRQHLRYTTCKAVGPVVILPLPEPSCHVFSDATGNWGCGAILKGTGWLQVPWPDSWKAIDIAAKELVPVVLAAVWPTH